LVCLFALTGCDRSEKAKDDALAEVQKLRAELVKAQTALEEIQDETDKLRVNLTITSEELADAQTERDELKENLAVISKELESTKLKLASAMQTQDDLEYQIAELTRQQNAAITSGQEDQSMIERLASQLEEKDGTISELERWNIEMQATIQELQNYIEPVEEQVEEEPQEEFEEQYEEEVYDQNDI
jgi:chromosome segregation ATPase